MTSLNWFTATGVKIYIREILKHTLQAADVVLTVNDYLKNKYAYLNPNIHVVKNATNYANFERENYTAVPFLEKLKAQNRPIIGYSGISNITRIDVEILELSFQQQTGMAVRICRPQR